MIYRMYVCMYVCMCSFQLILHHGGYGTVIIPKNGVAVGWSQLFRSLELLLEIDFIPMQNMSRGLRNVTRVFCYIWKAVGMKRISYSKNLDWYWDQPRNKANIDPTNKKYTVLPRLLN